jgi:hypothetical protein
MTAMKVDSPDLRRERAERLLRLLELEPIEQNLYRGPQ